MSLHSPKVFGSSDVTMEGECRNLVEEVELATDTPLSAHGFGYQKAR